MVERAFLSDTQGIKSRNHHQAGAVLATKLTPGHQRIGHPVATESPHKATRSNRMATGIGDVGYNIQPPL